MRATGVLDYRPQHLRETRRRVVERHPSTATISVEASQTRVEELRRRIRECADDANRLRRLADQLTGRDVRGIAGALGGWDEERPAAAEIVRRRMNRRLCRPLWRTWQRYPGPAEVAKLCERAGDQYGWDAMVDANIASQVASWVRSTDPGAAVRDWLADQDRTYSDLPHLPDNPLRPDTPLTRMVRTAVMTGGTARQLSREGGGRLVGWFPTLSPLDRQGFARQYLVTLEVEEWEDVVLRLIDSKYGSPRGDRQPFWHRVPPNRRDAFLQWRLRSKLDRVFAGDTDRHAYWLSKMQGMIDVETGKAGRTQYAWLDFGEFAVVEFFEVGNAAYFYSRDEARALRVESPGSPAVLKRRQMVRFGWTSVPNWLIHGSNWQSRADSYVARWRRGTKAGRR